MRLPTEEQCLNYFEEYVVPKNIFKHCLKVREVAVFLAKKLTEKGLKINLELVDRSALLHDLFKAISLEELKPNEFYNYEFSEEEIAMWKKLREKYEGMYECEIAYEIFKDKFPELASTIKKASDPKNKNKTWEELVVHYADWRVLKEEVVLTEERLYYLKQRYPGHDFVWEGHGTDLLVDEGKIFSELKFAPTELTREFNKHKD